MANPEDTVVKLAVLQPATEWDAPIELTLTDAILKDTSYECISYDRSSPKPKPQPKRRQAAATGDSTTDPTAAASAAAAATADDDADATAAANKTATVLVDGQEQEIPEPLETALRTFRRKERTRTLWADVLVGRTAEERSTQAAIQRQVLMSAERTLCWLGPDDGEKTAKAFETIKDMARRYDEGCQKFGLAHGGVLGHVTTDQMMSLRQHLFDCPFNDLDSFNFRHWRVIYDLFGSPYWDTVQAIAEIALAKAPVVICGRSNVSWSAYVSSSRALPFFQAKFFKVPLLPHTQRGCSTASQIDVSFRRRRLGEPLELLAMVHTARGCGPADPRDAVFAVLPVATPSRRLAVHTAGPQPLPAIDYRKTPQQVFSEAARYIVLERQDLLLWTPERAPCTKRLKGLPSWVPDYSTVLPDCPSVQFLNGEGGGMRAWWSGLPDTHRKLITVSEDGKALHLQVHPLDRIVHVSPVINGGNARYVCFAEYQKLPAAEARARRDERFWRAMVMDVGAEMGARLGSTQKPSATMGVHFHSMVAEESLLKELGCSMLDLRTPRNAARIRNEPELTALMRRCGHAEPYEHLLKTNAVGRRFFLTAGGRFGLGPIEDVIAADNGMLHKEPPKEEEEEEEGEGQGGERAMAQALGAMGRLTQDPLNQMMMSEFRQFAFQRSPEMGAMFARMMRGELPQEMNIRLPPRTDGGVMEGDVVVACVRGFYPYILRPRSRQQQQQQSEAGESSAAGESSSRPAGSREEDASTYEYVGECYLHGAMDGEDFRAVNALGLDVFRVDRSKIVDVTIV